ncbi:MAG: LacI family DNA-binding transcriptional regulator [Armatimonadota bacterium]
MAREPRNQENRPVRLSDVAERCGVRTMTVSYALRGETTHVRPELRARICAVAKEMGYDPARTIAARRLVGVAEKPIINHAIAFFVSPIFASSSLYFLRLFEGIDQEITRMGFALVIAHSLPSLELPPGKFLRSLPPMITRDEVDGLIMMGNLLYADQVAADLRAEFGFGNRPIISLIAPQPGCISVLADDYRGGYEAMAHLLALGHRKIAFYPLNMESFSHNERLRGYQQACRDAGCDPAAILVAVAFDNRAGDQEGGYIRPLLDILSVHAGITAILAPHDFLAVLIADTLVQQGYRIPEDLSLIGFDDANAWPAPYDNRLTTVAIPLVEMGQLATQTLFDVIEGRPVEMTYTLPTRLIVRGTTAVPGK